MDRLRKSALLALDTDERREKSAKAPRKATTAADLSHAREELEQMRRANLILLDIASRAIDDLGEIAMVKSDVARHRIAEDAIARARRSLMMNPPPFDKPGGKGLKLVAGSASVR